MVHWLIMTPHGTDARGRPVWEVVHNWRGRPVWEVVHNWRGRGGGVGNSFGFTRAPHVPAARFKVAKEFIVPHGALWTALEDGAWRAEWQD